MDEDIPLLFSAVRSNDLFYLLPDDFTEIVEYLERIIRQTLVNRFVLKMVFIKKSAVQPFEKEEGKSNGEFFPFRVFCPPHFMTRVRIHNILGDETRYIFRVEIYRS